MASTTVDPLSLAHHLRAAAQRYEADAAFCNELGTVHDGGRIAQQFLRQAQEARTWATAFEQCHQVEQNADGDIVAFYV